MTGDTAGCPNQLVPHFSTYTLPLVPVSLVPHLPFLLRLSGCRFILISDLWKARLVIRPLEPLGTAAMTTSELLGDAWGHGGWRPQQRMWAISSSSSSQLKTRQQSLAKGSASWASAMALGSASTWPKPCLPGSCPSDVTKPLQQSLLY